jgi:hypothetical protein
MTHSLLAVFAKRQWGVRWQGSAFSLAAALSPARLPNPVSAVGNQWRRPKRPSPDAKLLPGLSRS